MYYKLKVTIPEDEIFEKVQKDILSRISFSQRFLTGVVPPNRIELIFDKLTDDGVKSMKTRFRQLYSKSKYVNHCTFDVKAVG